MLGAGPDATLDEIRRAFRKKALKYHPDKGGDAQLFATITEAYEVMVALLETAEQEAEDFETIHVVLDRQPGESLGVHLEGRGKSPLCRVNVRSLVPGKIGTTCGLIAEGDIVVEVDGVGVRGLDFAEVLRRMRGVVGINRLELTFLRKKAVPATTPSDPAAMSAPAPPAPAAARGRKQSWLQQVNAEVAQGSSAQPAGTDAPTPAQSAASVGGRRKMSWLQRVEKQCLETDDAAEAAGKPAHSLSKVAEDDEDEDEDEDDVAVDRVVEDDEDEDEDESEDRVPEMESLPCSPAQQAGCGRRKMSFLQQVEMEVKREVSSAGGSSVTDAQSASAAPISSASPAKSGRRKASWLARASNASPRAGPKPDVLVFDELLDQNDDVTAAAGDPSTASPRKRSWLPRTPSAAPSSVVAPSAQPATIAEEDDSSGEGSGGSDSESDFGGVSAAEANEALNRLASMHGVAQRASWVDTGMGAERNAAASSALGGTALSNSRAAASIRPDEGVATEENSTDPSPNSGSPAPRSTLNHQWLDSTTDNLVNAAGDCPPLNWRLIWSRRFRLLYLLCRLPKEATASTSASAIPALRAMYVLE